MGTVWAFGVFGGTNKKPRKTGSPEPVNRHPDNKERSPVRPSGPKMDGGTPTKDPPKRGPLFAARAGFGAVAVVQRTPATGNQKQKKRNRRTASAARMRNRRSCAGFFGSAQPTEERGSAPGRGSPDRANAHKNHLEISGSGPTGSPARLPLLIWNSPEPAAGLAFGKAASRPVKPARGSASRFTPPPHHQAGFRKGPLRREKRASESGPFRRSRKRPPTHPSRGAPAGRLPRLPLRFPAMSPVDPGRRMENHRENVQPSGRAAQRWMVERRRKTRQNADRLRRPAREPEPWRSSAGRPPRGTKRKNQKKEPKERTHPQAGRGLVPACSGRRDRGLSFVRSCFLATAKKQGWGLAPGQAAGGAGHIFFTPLRCVKKIPGCPLR